MLLALLVVALVGGGIFLLASGDDDDDDDSEQTTDTTAGDDSDSDDDSDSGDSGGDSEAEEDAEAVLQDFMAAEEESDCETIVSLLSDSFLAGGDSAEAVSQCEQTYEDYGGLSVEGEPEVTSSDSESVSFEVPQNVGGTDLTATYDLVLEDGEWKVEDFGSI